MKTKLSLFLVCIVLAGGCKRYERIDDLATTPAPVVVTRGQETEAAETEEPTQETREVEIEVNTKDGRRRRRRIDCCQAHVRRHKRFVLYMVSEPIRTPGHK